MPTFITATRPSANAPAGSAMPSRRASRWRSGGGETNRWGRIRCPCIREDFQVIPPGDYQMMLVASNPTSTNKGVNLEFDISAGEYQGRKVWTNLKP